MLLGLVPVVLIAIVVFSNIRVAPVSSGDNLKYTGVACIYIDDKLVECNHNIITNNGKDLIKKGMMGIAQVRLNQIAVANRTTPLSESDISLQGEWISCGMERATGTLTDLGVGNWSISYQWKSTCDDVIVNATGIYDSISGTLFAEAVFNRVAILQTNEKINITYYTWIN